ncbi:hypothetical protein ACR9HU_24825 (plasmid) [Enterobacter ludwigii]
MADVSLWVPVLTALAGICGALGSQYVSHLLIRKREEKTRKQKLASDMAFIGASLVIYLEECHHQFTLVANDYGESNGWDGYVQRHPLSHVNLPVISAVEGNWTVLPGQLMLRIREIPHNVAKIDHDLELIKDNELDYPDHTRFFKERRQRYQDLANQCVVLENELRTLCDFPDAIAKE